MSKLLYYLIIGILFLLSFFFYSSLFYPALNSDNGVGILMIHYFKWPNDIYFWGQDRVGSIIPLIGQIPFKVFHLSALLSESIVRYTILLLGFLSFTTFIKSNFYKIIFAVIWFLPPMRLIDGIQFYSGIEYSFLAMSCYLFELTNNMKVKESVFLTHLVLLLITTLLITAVWISDMALITIFIILFVQLFFYLRTHKLFKEHFTNPKLYYVIFGIIIGYLFIHYAKSIPANKNDYSVLSDPQTVVKTLTIFVNTIIDLLLFKANEPFTSLYSYFVILFVVYSIFVFRKVTFNDATKKIVLYFLLDALILFTIIMISKWTILNHVPRRYFTCTYISLSFVLLLLFDNFQLSKQHKTILKSFLAFTVFVGAIGTFYNLNYVYPKTLTPKVEVVGEFQQLGKIGIIAEYWNSYIISCVNPDLIKATPHDKSGCVRNYEVLEEVFTQKNIYVVKDMWLDTFPDTLIQFNRVLVKDSSEFRIGDCNVCKYRNIP